MLGCVLALALTLGAPADAGATRPLTTGLIDLYNPAYRIQWGPALGANIGMVGTGISWATTAPTRPAHPRDPADPAYNWSAVDPIVKGAARRGLSALLTITYAPDWAEGPGKEHALYANTWKPDAQALGDFAHALAMRYSGDYRHLPRVRNFEPWSEPNLPALLSPQWEHGKPASPEMYRRMANAVYAGVKSVHGNNRVIGPALEPYGDPPNNPRYAQPRMRPIQFLRQLFCLKDRRKLKKQPCPDPVKLDVISHHPFTSTHPRQLPPNRHAINPDDAAAPDLGRVMRVVRAAQRKGTVLPKGKHRKLWVTESWWLSKPPNRRGVSPPKQARFVEQGLYLYWKAGASVVLQEPLRDRPGNPFSGAGLIYSNGKPKPAYTAFRFPFVTDRRSHRKVLAWGKAPATGRLKIQVHKKHRGWKTVKRRHVHEDQVFKKSLRLKGKAKLRAKVGSQKSLTWKQKK